MVFKINVLVPFKCTVEFASEEDFLEMNSVANKKKIGSRKIKEVSG